MNAKEEKQRQMVLEERAMQHEQYASSHVENYLVTLEAREQMLAEIHSSLAAKCRAKVRVMRDDEKRHGRQ